MSPEPVSAESAIRAALAGAVRLDYGNTAPDRMHIYPVIDARLPTDEFHTTIVRLAPPDTIRLVRLLRNAAEGPSAEFSQNRQKLLHAFYTANMQASQLDMLDARHAAS